jgi:hypothetical protein
MKKQFKLLSDEDQWHLFEIQYYLKHHDWSDCGTCNPIFEIELTPDEIVKIQKHLQEDDDDEIVTSPCEMELSDYRKWRSYDYIAKREEIEKYIEEIESFEECLEKLPILCPKCNSEKICPEGYIFGEWSCIDCGFIFAAVSEGA